MANHDKQHDWEEMTKRFNALDDIGRKKLLLFAQILLDAKAGHDTLNNAWYRACQMAENEEKETTNNA